MNHIYCELSAIHPQDNAMISCVKRKCDDSGIDSDFQGQCHAAPPVEHILPPLHRFLSNQCPHHLRDTDPISAHARRLELYSPPYKEGTHRTIIEYHPRTINVGDGLYVSKVER